MFVITCDVFLCVNPEHLIVASQSWNIQSMYDKGHRTAKGEKNGASKLKNEQVLQIREDNRPNRVIGRDFGISEGLVRFIKKRQRWGHLDGTAEQTSAADSSPGGNVSPV
jgi:hypothetical protein